jgi:glycosyltransferase involved in cell wall biosynthesis
MKILIVTHYFLPHKGGIEFVAYNQAKELVKMGNQVTIVSSKVGDEPEQEVMDGIKIRRVKVFNWFERKWGVPYPVFSSKIFSVLNEEAKDADVVHVHDLFYLSSFAAALIAKIKKKPVILTQHVKTVKHKKFIVNFFQEFVKSTYGKFIINYAKKILVYNQNVKIWINREEKTQFIENSVDTNLFKPTTKENKLKLRKKYNLSLNKPIILFVGRLVAIKAFERLFEARDKDYLILFVGGGEIPNEMKECKDVLFLGEQTQNKLKEFYQLSDIFCLPSRSEGFPLSVLEAMASGLPSIVSDLPIYHKHFDRNSLEIIKPTPKNIKIVIKKILRENSLIKSLSENSRKIILKRFDWKINVKNLLKIYKGTIK